jgi:hypothetical protein
MEASHNFAGLACDAITPAIIHKVTAADMAEYDTLFSFIDATTSIDWRSHSCNVAVISQILASPTPSLRTNSGAFWSSTQLRDFGVGLCFYFSSLHLVLLPIS